VDGQINDMSARYQPNLFYSHIFTEVQSWV